MAEVQKHLWEVDHPYYATEGNYFSNDCHATYKSWADFKGEVASPFGGGSAFSADRDMNLIYRWDWHKADPDEGEEIPGEELRLFIVGQRKAIHRSEFVNVTEGDEPEVRAWLIVCAKTIAAIWAPIEDDDA